MAFNVKGLSVQDILNLDYDTFMNLSRSEMAVVTSRLASAANKRLRNFEKKGLTESPAYQKAMKSGGNFSVKGKDLNALRAEYKRVRQFTESKVSTVKEWRKTKKEIVENLQKKGVNITNESFEDFFNAFHKLAEMSPDVNLSRIKYDVFKDISDKMKSNTKSPDEVATELVDKVSALYEEATATEQSRMAGGVSEYFD